MARLFDDDENDDCDFVKSMHDGARNQPWNERQQKISLVKMIESRDIFMIFTRKIIKVDLKANGNRRKKSKYDWSEGIFVQLQ